MTTHSQQCYTTCCVVYANQLMKATVFTTWLEAIIKLLVLHQLRFQATHNCLEVEL